MACILCKDVFFDNGVWGGVGRMGPIKQEANEHKCARNLKLYTYDWTILLG
jgi:hypothetical protein